MKRKRNVMTSPLVVIPLIAGAAWVNLPLLKRAVSSLGSSSEVDAELDPGGPGAVSGGLRSAPGGVTLGFAPVEAEAEVPDPFLHPDEADMTVEGAMGSTADGPLARPEVSLVLCSAGSKRAVVDGVVVGIGDEVEFGVVQDITAGGVSFRRKGTQEVFVGLREAPKPTPEGAAVEAEADNEKDSPKTDRVEELERQLREALGKKAPGEQEGDEK